MKMDSANGEQHRRWRGIMFLGLAAALGCGGTPAGYPELGQVDGTVTLDGQPLANADIMFGPTKGGRPAQARTESDGGYELTYIGAVEGAELGTYKVTISKLESGDPSDTAPPEYKQLVPDRYNTKSELSVEVKSGSQTHDFDLTSE